MSPYARRRSGHGKVQLNCTARRDHKLAALHLARSRRRATGRPPSPGCGGRGRRASRVVGRAARPGLYGGRPYGSRTARSWWPLAWTAGHYGWWETEAGRYRLRERADTAAFRALRWPAVVEERAPSGTSEAVVGGIRRPGGVQGHKLAEPPRYALLGVHRVTYARSRLDQVLTGRQHADPVYRGRARWRVASYTARRASARRWVAVPVRVRPRP